MSTANTTDAGQRYVWLMANSFTRWLWKDFAHKLARETGLRPLLIVGTELDRKFYADQYGEAADFDFVVQTNPYEAAVETDLTQEQCADIVARARRIEKEYGITFERECILADRNLGRGFMPGALGHPRSTFAEIKTLESSLRGCAEAFEETEQWFEQYPPALVVSYYGGTGLTGKAISLPCHKRGIPFRAFCPARFGQLAYWAENEMESNARLSALLAQPSETLPESEIETIRAEVQPSGLATDATQQRLIRRLTGLPGVIKAAAVNAASVTYGRMKGYFNRRYGNTIASTTRYMFRARRHWKLLNEIADKEIPNIPGRKLVYLPLQQEPEQSTLVLTPNHSNQLATIHELALSLPADALLLVKEHIWQLGRRPAHVYRTIMDIPNARLLHPTVSSIDTIKASSLVCTITSSAGYEAAALGKKTVFFWEKCPLAGVPHITVMSGFADMSRIAGLLEDDTPEAEAKRRNDGALFFKRLNEFCFDVGEMNFYGRTERPDDKALDLLCTTLIDSLSEAEQRLHPVAAE